MAKKETEKEEKTVQKRIKKGSKNNEKSKKTSKTIKKAVKLEEKEEKKNKSPSKTKKVKYDEILFNKIREDLLEQLEIKGLIQESYKNLVEDYMKLWIIKELLNKDIEKRGINIKYDNGGGQKGIKRNESITDITKINTQMLKILKELNLTPVEDIPSGGSYSNDDSYY